MAQEFDRDTTWTDWKGVEYTLREQWAYVTGPARALEGCTSGTRDANNDGVTPTGFLERGNDLIRRQRLDAERSGAALMPLSHAFLTMDEMLAIRLYSVHTGSPPHTSFMPRTHTCTYRPTHPSAPRALLLAC